MASASSLPSLQALALSPAPPSSANLAPLRQQAVDALEAGLSWPSPKAAAWRHTPLQALADVAWSAGSEGHTEAPDEAAVRALLPPLGEQDSRLVLVDGVPAWTLCRLPLADGGTYVADLAHGVSDRPALTQHIDPINLRQVDALAALSAARLHHGALVHLRAGASLDGQLQLIFVHSKSSAQGLVQPRVLVVLDERAEASILEHHVGMSGAACWSNAVTDLVLAQGAQLKYAQVQVEDLQAHHLATLTARVHRDAKLTLCVLDEGARTLRRSLQVDLLEPGAEAQLMQVALGRGGQRLDVPSVVRHLSPQTRSTQAFRTAVADSAQAAFRGLVNIALDAQQVSAKQMSRALLLGGGAQAILKPQLMILADDVKCQHGATVGQLDEDAMFYLVSRGIDAATARQMLTYAFLADAFSEAPPTLGAALMARACAWLGLDPSISSIRIPEAP